MIIWKPVKGYEGLYEVSNNGLIRTVEREYKSGEYRHIMVLPQKLMSFKTDKDGYYYLGLRKNKVRKFKRVNRIVCESFHPNPENKPLVNHKDGNKQNNDESNVEWNTISENELHSYRVLGKIPTKPWEGKKEKLNPSSKPLYQYDLDGNLIKEWESFQLAEDSGFNRRAMRLVLMKKNKHHRGFFWSRQK